jgi:trigger factor
MEIQEIEFCKYKIDYTASAELLSEKKSKAVNEFRKYKIPGFRKGKATDTAIKVAFKDQISEFVKNELLNHAHEDILFETKMKPIGKPQIDKLLFDGNNFSCSLIYLKKPEFDLKEYKGLEIPEPHMDYTADSLAEKHMQSFRLSHGELIPYGDGDVVKSGDKVTLSYTVSEGEPNEGMMYAVGSGQISKEFDDAIIGMSPGEDRSFDIMGVNYVVKLHMGLTVKPHPLDEELAVKAGHSSLKDLVKAAEAAAHRQFKIERSGKIAEQIKLKLIADNNFECPTWLISMEAQHIAAYDSKRWETLSEDEKSPYLSRAESNVRFSLILDSIRDVEKEISISDAEAFEGIKDSLITRGLDQNQIKQAINNGYIHGMIANFKDTYAIQWLVDNAKVIS